jgi:cytochrome c oxidase subunit 2
MLGLPFLIAVAVVLVLRHSSRSRTLLALVAGATTLLAPALAVAQPAAAPAMGPPNSTLPPTVTGKGWWLPPDGSLDGWRTDQLITGTTWFVLVVFAVVVLWIVVAVLMGRRKSPAAPYPFHRPGVVVVAVCVVIIAAEDAALFVRSLTSLQKFSWGFAAADADPAAVRIQINAHQWVWEARYAGADGQFNTPDDIVVLNHLRVPAGARILFQLASTDVIHGFSLPNFRVKQDAVPGMINWLTFTTRHTGDYAIACQQHCGVGHYKMKGVLSVLPPDDYVAWVKRASALARRAYDPGDKPAHWGWSWERPRPGEARMGEGRRP